MLNWLFFITYHVFCHYFVFTEEVLRLQVCTMDIMMKIIGVNFLFDQCLMDGQTCKASNGNASNGTYASYFLHFK